MPRHIETIALRMTPLESAAIDYGCHALDLGVSQLMAQAGLEAAFALGYTLSGKAAIRARPGSWKDAPRRDEGDSATLRQSVSINSAQATIFEEVCSAHDVTLPAFLIGATLRFLSDLKQKNPKAFTGLRLPKQYA